MRFRLSVLCAAFACALAAQAETVYKYRDATGRTVYANRPLPALELIEAFEYRFPEPAPDPDAGRRALEAERRIAERLAALAAAWEEVQAASRAVAAAEARLLAGAEPQSGEARSLAGPAKPPAPAVGGAQAPAVPQAGGPAPAGAPAVGGPLGTRRGGGRQPEYPQRIAELGSEAAAARERLAAAWRRYNALR